METASRRFCGLPPGPVEHLESPPGSYDWAAITIGHEFGPGRRVVVVRVLDWEKLPVEFRCENARLGELPVDQAGVTTSVAATRKSR
jgi:hypothetical protein